jgi:hypothetical protein
MGVLPYALVFLCVAVHFLMHGGHGGGPERGIRFSALRATRISTRCIS